MRSPSLSLRLPPSHSASCHPLRRLAPQPRRLPPRGRRRPLPPRCPRSPRDASHRFVPGKARRDAPRRTIRLLRGRRALWRGGLSRRGRPEPALSAQVRGEITPSDPLDRMWCARPPIHPNPSHEGFAIAVLVLSGFCSTTTLGCSVTRPTGDSGMLRRWPAPLGPPPGDVPGRLSAAQGPVKLIGATSTDDQSQHV